LNNSIIRLCVCVCVCMCVRTTLYIIFRAMTIKRTPILYAGYRLKGFYTCGTDGKNIGFVSRPPHSCSDFKFRRIKKKNKIIRQNVNVDHTFNCFWYFAIHSAPVVQQKTHIICHRVCESGRDGETYSHINSQAIIS
jgi:hypothetical protein